MGGQAGVSGHLQIGDNAIVGGQAGVTKAVPEGAYVSGYPARPHMTAMREEAALTRLPELLKRVRQLEKELERISRLIEAKTD